LIISILPSETDSETLFEKFISRDTVRGMAIDLLKRESVGKYIGNSYPIIVVDEFQDCTGNLLEIIKGLSTSSTIFIASDPFQQLSDPEDLEGIEWIKKNCFEHNDLDLRVNHRTTDHRILKTASCLREGILHPGRKIDIFPWEVPSPSLSIS